MIAKKMTKLPRYFRPIEGHEGWGVNRRGDIVDNNGLLRKPNMSQGRLIVTANGTSITVARAVGAAFCDDYAPHLYAYYANGDKSDCRPSNLRWVERRFVTKPPYTRNPQ